MDLVYAVAMMGAFMIIGAVAYLGARMPRTPKWAGETASSLWAVLMVCLLAFAVGFAVRFATTWETQVFGVREGLTTVVIVVAYALAWMGLGVRGRLARYAGEARAPSQVPSTTAAEPVEARAAGREPAFPASTAPAGGRPPRRAA